MAVVKHHGFRALAVIGFFTLLFLKPQLGHASGSEWLLIETGVATLKVMQGDSEIARFENISVGRGGLAVLHLLNDDTTPLGTYRVTSVDPSSRYRLFIGLNYPTVEQAELALARHIIDDEHFRRIVEAHRRGAAPPMSTPLGGAIGIHGVGNGNLEVHESFNWTHGCVALSNRQIDALAAHVRIGTRVVIRE